MEINEPMDTEELDVWADKIAQAMLDDPNILAKARTAIRLITHNIAQRVIDTPWLDPECGHKGCQSLVWKSRYESAVQGRADFREAYATLRSAPADERQRDLIVEIGRLRELLPVEMPECKIEFKECEKGHGRLTAKNWIDHGCPQCAIEHKNASLRELTQNVIITDEMHSRALANLQR